MFIPFQMIIIISPILVSIYFAYKVYDLYVILDEEGLTGKNELKFNSWKDFLLKNVLFQLKVKEEIINKVIQAYKKLIFSIIIYIVWGIGYFLKIIFDISGLFSNYHNITDSTEFGAIIGIIISSIFIFIQLFLIPLLKFLNLKKAYNLIEVAYSNLFKLSDKIIKFIKWQLFIVFCTITSFFLISLIKNLISNSKYIQIEMNFFNSLIFLIFYQYILLRIFSWILKLIIIKVKRKKTILSYYQGNTLYSILKNSTYVSMIFVTAIAQVTDKTGTPMAQAIGILFLIDTYFTNLENIRLQINEINNCK